MSALAMNSKRILKQRMAPGARMVTIPSVIISILYYKSGGVVKRKKRMAASNHLSAVNSLVSLDCAHVCVSMAWLANS